MGRQNVLTNPMVATAIVGGIFGLATTLLTNQQAFKRQDEEIKQIGGRVENQLPVGTIIASMLKPGQFEAKYSVTGPEINGKQNPSNFLWVLADGRSVEGSEYAKTAGDLNIPDLRGMFLRGINIRNASGATNPEGDTETDRRAGTLQNDLLKNHTHGIKGADDADSGKGNTISMHKDKSGDFANASTAGATDSGHETRPKNVAVYYYIKIN